MNRLRTALASATLLSLLAHWLVLDSMRAASMGVVVGGRRHSAPMPSIHAHIFALPTVPDEAPPPDGNSAGLKASTTPTHRASERDIETIEAHTQTSILESSSRVDVPADMSMESDGMVARNATEGLIAYRLALAEAGVPLDVSSGAEVALVLSVDAQGRGAAVRLRHSSGDVARDRAVQDWVMRASARVEVPEPLRGQAFDIDVSVE